jgi:hypothetical protein
MESGIRSCISGIDTTLAEAFYVFHGVSITLKSNTPTVISQIDKIYGLFRAQSSTSSNMELTVLVKNQDTSQSDNIQIYSTVPSSFEGWERERSVGVMKNLVHEVPERRKGRRTYTLEVSDKFGWVHQLNYCILLFILYMLSNLCLLHAGVVASGNKGLILPGVSGSGKTTLVYALVKRGFRFLSDDFAFVEPSTLKVLPFPKSFTFTEDASGLFEEVRRAFDRGDVVWLTERKCFLNMQQLGINEIGEPIDVGYIIFPKYSPNNSPEVIKITRERASRKLLEDGSLKAYSLAQKQTFSVEDLARRLPESAECYELVSNSLDETINLIEDLMKGT